MCGIIGYIGKRKAKDVLLAGLKRLEYRGYDSCGIAVFNGGRNIQVARKEGRINVLEDALNSINIDGYIGIGHTRWATHGHPSDANAHPHCDGTGRIAIVHNGIIENYRILTEELTHKGHVFNSETDTESVVHLIADNIQSSSIGLLDAIRSALKRLIGQYAFCIISSNEPEKIIAIRNGAPLIIGIGEGENFVASDAAAMLPYTRRVIYLKDGEIAIITRDEVLLTNLDGSAIPLRIKEIQWSLEETEKSGFETFMLKEIYEQPDALRRTFCALLPQNDFSIKCENEPLTPQKLRRITKIYLISCGTAYHAAMAGKYFLDMTTGIDVQTDYASEFRYRRLKLAPDQLVIVVSQSGETADTLASLRVAKTMGSSVLSIVNVQESTITRESNHTIYTSAGPEMGVASTKAYTSQIMALNIFAIFLGYLRGDISSEEKDFYLSELRKIPTKVEEILQNTAGIEKCANEIGQAKSSFYIGRGFNFPTALEGALKNKEISYMHCEGYSGGEMKHGPIALIHKDFPVVSICTKGATYEKMVSNIQESVARGAHIVTVASDCDTFIKSISDAVLYVPETIEELSPMVNIVPLQLLAYYIAKLRGCDIDKPRNLAKSVTVE
jgi:glutamine---fructose-6-phosphate transaminase (isomerizing)